jgi:hypothetical protein
MHRDKSSSMGRTMNETQFDSKTETRPMGVSSRLSGGPAAHCRHSSGSKSKCCTLGLLLPLLLDCHRRRNLCDFRALLAEAGRLFERVRHFEDAEVCFVAADNLHANRKSFGSEASRH